MGKLRLLGVHGYMQDGQVFRTKTGSVRKALKQLVDPAWTFPDAPHTAVSLSDEAAYGGGGARRAWWLWVSLQVVH